MDIGLSTKTQGRTELASLQDTPDSEHVAFVDTLDAEIKTVIEQASTFQRYDYVLGETRDVWTSPKNHLHFDLIHRNEETNKSDRIHCVIFAFRRASISTNINEGMQVAVAGDVSFHPPENHCSIKVEEVVPIGADGSQRFYEVIPVPLWIAIVAVFVIVLVLGGYLLLG